MRQITFTLLLLSLMGLISCRKDKYQPTVQQFDQTQIQNYIKSNNIQGMMQDTTGGDTSGIYYKIIIPGTGTRIGDTSNIAFVFTLRSFDGKYTNTDTILNHYEGYAGHIITNALPFGLQLAIINNLKYRGGSMRILIPSNLAYGVKGYGTGSTSTANTHIAGNQCLDYYVRVINNIPATTNPTSPGDNQATYDNLVIQNYIKRNNLTGYIPVDTGKYKGLYYKIAVPGTGTSSITENSTITVTYEGRLLNGNIIEDAYNSIADTAQVEVPNMLVGQQGAIMKVTSGATVSMLIPSGLAYGVFAQTGIPPNSCLRYEYEVRRVSP